MANWTMRTAITSKIRNKQSWNEKDGQYLPVLFWDFDLQMEKQTSKVPHGNALVVTLRDDEGVLRK